MLKANRFLLVIALFLFMVFMGSCGGGGDGGGDGAQPDTTPPTIVSTSPANNATGVAVDTSITATFSENMDSSTINTSTFYIVGISGTVSYSGNTATFKPLTNLNYNTTYTAVITTGVKDVAGNAMTSDYIWSFTTTGGGGGNKGEISATLADDCTYGQPYLLVNGTLNIGGAPCGISSINVNGASTIDGKFHLVASQGPFTVGFTAYYFNSTSMSGQYILSSSYPYCYDTGNFSMNKVSGNDSCGGMTGNWSGQWESKPWF